MIKNEAVKWYFDLCFTCASATIVFVFFKIVPRASGAVHFFPSHRLVQGYIVVIRVKKTQAAVLSGLCCIIFSSILHCSSLTTNWKWQLEPRDLLACYLCPERPGEFELKLNELLCKFHSAHLSADGRSLKTSGKCAALELHYERLLSCFPNLI